MPLQYVKQLFTDVPALASGIGSFVLMALACFLDKAWSPYVFWPLTYVAVAFAGYRIWESQVRANDSVVSTLKHGMQALRNENVALTAKLNATPASLGDIQDVINSLRLEGRALRNASKDLIEWRDRAKTILRSVLRDRKYQLMTESDENLSLFMDGLVNDSLRLTQSDVRDDVPKHQVLAWKPIL
ncbi:MAG: hypothetical protein ACJ8C4_16420 [Gemmataceae bacterium]